MKCYEKSKRGAFFFFPLAALADALTPPMARPIADALESQVLADETLEIFSDGGAGGTERQKVSLAHILLISIAVA